MFTTLPANDLPFDPTVERDRIDAELVDDPLFLLWACDNSLQQFTPGTCSNAPFLLGVLPNSSIAPSNKSCQPALAPGSHFTRLAPSSNILYDVARVAPSSACECIKLFVRKP